MGTHPIFESDFDCLTDRMGNRQTSHLPDITKWKWDPDQVYVILYQYDLTKNTTLNSISTTISESISGIDHISACSIVVFNKEYQFQRQHGIVTAYDPGHLSEHVLREPLQFQNMNISQAEWQKWLNAKKQSDYNPSTFDNVSNNFNHFVRDAASFFGYDLCQHDDFRDILNEGKENMKKIKEGTLRAAMTVMPVSEIASDVAGLPTVAKVSRVARTTAGQNLLD